MSRSSINKIVIKDQNDTVIQAIVQSTEFLSVLDAFLISMLY